MTVPPLAASERQLARLAALLSWLCLLVGLICALAPRLCLRVISLGGHGPVALATQLFGALAGAGLIGLAVSLRRTARDPRIGRTGFAPLLALLATNGIALVLVWRRGDVLGFSARPLGVIALVSLVLFVVLLVAYSRAAPGVNLGPAQTPTVAATAPKAVQLGVRSPAPADVAPPTAAPDAPATASQDPAAAPSPHG